MLQHWRTAGCPEDMHPLLVPVPPWVAMKQPLVQQGTRGASQGTALEAAAEAADAGVAEDADHAAQPGTESNQTAEDASGSPPPPSTPSKGTHKEPVVLVMACGYAWCALGGHFPLAGTYFQHNEVFLDTCSVLHHIQVRTVVWEQQRGCLCTCMCQQVVDLHAMCRYPPRCGGRPRQPAPASRWCLAPTRATCAEA